MDHFLDNLTTFPSGKLVTYDTSAVGRSLDMNRRV